MSTNAATQHLGVAIVQTLYAMAQEKHKESIEDWIHLCNTAADEAFAAVIGDPPPRYTGPRGAAERLRDEWNALHPESPILAETLDDEDVLEGQALLDAARAAAAAAFRENMPHLVNRLRIRAHVACTAVAMQRGFLDAASATKLLYAAQTALTANPKRQQRRAQKG